MRHLTNVAAVLAIILLLGAPALAVQGTPSTATPAVLPVPATTPLTSIDVVSYAGLAIVVVALVEVAKLLWKDWISGKEPILSLGLTLVLGPVTKLTVPHAYENVPWVIFIVSLVVLQIPLNKMLHDSTLQPLTDAAKESAKKS